MSGAAIASTGRLGLMLTELRLPTIKRLAADLCTQSRNSWLPAHLANSEPSERGFFTLSHRVVALVAKLNVSEFPPHHRLKRSPSEHDRRCKVHRGRTSDIGRQPWQSHVAKSLTRFGCYGNL